MSLQLNRVTLAVNAYINLNIFLSLNQVVNFHLHCNSCFFHHFCNHFHINSSFVTYLYILDYAECVQNHIPLICD